MSTPSAPDVDQPEGGAHGGSPGPDQELEEAGRTPGQQDADTPDE